MNKTLVKFVLGFACAGLMLSISSVVGTAQSPDEQPSLEVTTQYEGENYRQVSPDAISFIESPSPSCYQPDRTRNVCYINLYYLSVSTDQNQNMKSLTVEINNRVVANYQGFFQNSFYIPFNMNGNGFKVACGKLGVSGNPDMGRAYKVVIRAEDTGGLKSSNTATVYCPPFLP